MSLFLRREFLANAAALATAAALGRATTAQAGERSFMSKAPNPFVPETGLPNQCGSDEKSLSTSLEDPPMDNLRTPTDLSRAAVTKISDELRKLLADVYAIYLKTKNFHWHMSGPHFRDYHLLLDEQAEQLFSITDEIAERARKIGGTSLHSIGEISRLQRVKDNDKEFVTPKDMFAELSADNQHLTKSMRAAHAVCEQQNDVATASVLEIWIDQSERRTWFLFEVARELEH
jgi:starvation-inducible DNA-binding protein